MSLDFHSAYFAAIARHGASAFADACERYLHIQKDGGEGLRQLARQYFTGDDLAHISERINRFAPIDTFTDCLTSRSTAVNTISVPVHFSQVEESCHLESGLNRAVLSDPELGRLAVARREVSEYRLWSYAHQLKREGDGSGRMEKTVLLAHLMDSGIIASKRTFDAILARGERLYWRQKLSLNPAGETALYIELTGWKKLSRKLTKIELSKHPEWVLTNRPGMTRVWVDLSGSLQQVHAALYAAWMGIKAQKTGFVEIARSVLVMLWNRAKKTLLEWEKVAGIQTEARYGEHHDIHAYLVPAHAYLCAEQGGGEFVSWRLPNRYIPTTTHIHQHPGQRRKVRGTVNEIVENFASAHVMGGGRWRVERTGRIYFSHSQRTRHNGHDGKVTTEFVSAYKLIDRHLRKHGDEFDRRHYAYLTKRHHVHVLEYTTGQAHRGAISHRDLHIEETPTFCHRRMIYKIGWVDRYA